MQSRVDRFSTMFEPDESILDQNDPNARFALRRFHYQPISLGQSFPIHNRKSWSSKRDRCYVQQVGAYRYEGSAISKRIRLGRPVRRADCDYNWELTRLHPINDSCGKNPEAEKNHKDNKKAPAGGRLVGRHFARSLFRLYRIRVGNFRTWFGPPDRTGLSIVRSGRLI